MAQIAFTFPTALPSNGNGARSVESGDLSSITILSEGLRIVLKDTRYLLSSSVQKRGSTVVIRLTKEIVPDYVELSGPSHILMVELTPYETYDTVMLLLSDREITIISKPL